MQILIIDMTRGNQRDIDRERAQKRMKDKGQPKGEKGPSWEKTKDTHAEIMRQKQKAHEDKKGE